MGRYYKHIDSNPHFYLRDVSPLLRLALREKKFVNLPNAFSLGGITYTIGFDSQRGELTLRWEEGDGHHTQRIRVEGEPSNIPSLSGSYVYYFICPRTGTKCRVLYKMAEGGFCGRKALPKALYALQMESKSVRYIHYPLDGKEPYKPYGKEYYRGKLTPYGRKCQRYEEAIERRDKAFWSNLKI